MQFIFFEPASDSSSAVRDRVLFIREDAESANWQEEEYSLQAMFPFLSEKEIKRGMRIGFTDEVGDFQAFEIRKVRNYEPDGYQEITAEHIVIAELTDEFTDEQSFTNVPPNVALAAVLSGTQWQVGTVAVGDLQAQQTARQNIAALQLNGNVDLTSRPVVSRAKMRASGYADFSAESATLYPQIYTWDVEENNAEVTKATFLITPIRQDGVVYSLDRLNDYVLDLYDASQTYADLTAADHDRLLIHVLSGKQLSAIENISDQAEALSAAWESAIVAEASSGDISRGKVWPAVCSIKGNWNVYITPRITWGSTGITGRYLDIETYGGVFRGLYLSIDKNADEMGVTVDDTNVSTAMRGFGRNIEDENTHISSPLTFASVAWTQTADHPAKPSGQNYLENPAAAQYKRYGRHRWGFYQNSSIDDPVILLQKTWEALKQVSAPDVTINCVVRDMYRLGYKDVPMRLHDRAMVYEINTGETLLLEIVNLSHNLLNAMETRPTIGKYIPNIIYINRETNEGKRSFGGGGSKGQSAEEYERGEFETAIDYNKYQIGLRATQYDLKDQSYRTALAQAQIDIQHNAIDSIVGGVGMTLDANGYAVVDANGNPVFNVGSKTVFSRVNQLAEQYAVQVVNDKMSGYLLVDAFSTKLGNELTGANGETIAANIVTKINDNQGTIYLNSDHVKLKDGSIITASTLDARLADIDALFTTNGYSKTIVTNSMTAKTSMTSPTISADNFYFRNENGGLGDRMGTKQVQFFKGGAYQAIKPVGIGSDTVMNLRHSHEITITELSGANAGKIQITMGEAVATNSADRIKNFKIADTSYYQAGVSAARSSVVVNAVNWNTPNITENAQKEHGKYASISGTVQLAYQTGVDGGGNPIMTNIGSPIGIGPQEITSVYNTGFEDGAVAGGAAVVQRTAANLKAAITLPASHTGKATISDNIVVYSDTTESSNFPVEIDASAVYAAGKNNVKPTNTPTGWRWVASGNDNVLQNIVTAANPNVPTETAKQTAVTVSFPDLTQEVTSSQAIVKALDGVVAAFAINKGTATPNAPGSAAWNSSTHQYTITADGAFSVGGVSIAQNQGSMTFTPSNAFTYAFNQCYGSIGLSEASQELNPGDSVTIYPKAYSTYDVSINPNAQPQNITTKGITITAKQAATVTPKVSKKTWSSSGSLTFEGTTASSDPTSAGVALGWVTVPNTSNGNADLSVVDKASPYSSAQPHTVLEKNLTLTCENDAAYLKDGGTTLAKVPNNKTISASIDSIALRTAGGVQYVYDDVERKFTAYLKATGTNVAEKTGEVDIPAASAIEHGKRLVSAVLAESASSADAPSTLVSGKTYNLYRVVDGTRESAALAAYTVPEASTPSTGATRYVLNLDPLTLTAADAANISQNSPLIKTTLASYTDGIKEKDRPIEISVNAWEIYQAGINQGMNGVVNVVKGAWSTSSGISSITFSPSAGNGAEATVELSKVPVENSASATGTINLMDGSQKITSVSLRLAKSLDGSYVSLYYGMSSGGLNGDIYDAIYGGLNKTELARIAVNGTAGGESTISVLKSIGDITLTEDDVGTSVKYPLLTYQDGTKLNDGVNQIPVTVDASAVYLRGQSDGSNVQIEPVRSYGTAATNHKLYTIQPSGNNSVMAAAEIYVDVPDGVKSVSKLSSALEASTYNGWTAELGPLSMSYPYAYCYATGENGKRYNFKIDASEVYNLGMSAAAGGTLQEVKNLGTIRSSQTLNVTPDDGAIAMKKVTAYIDVPKVKGTEAVGEVLPGSHTVTPTGGYDAMKAVTFTVPSVTGALAGADNVYNPPGVQNVRLGHQYKVEVKFGNTVMQTIYFRCVQ